MAETPDAPQDQEPAVDPDALTEAEIEAGRLLFARPWQFLLGIAAVRQLPPEAGIEVAFAGRSNVGKSSLINALTGRKALARTSNTPGRTRELNFFAAAETASASPIVIVDMPGYGYAKVAKTAVANWTGLIIDYLKGRTSLKRVYLLIDARHGLKENDGAVMDLLDATAMSYQIVLTKADKPKKGELEKAIEKTRAGIAKRPAAHPKIILTSSEKGTGIAELRAEITRLASL